MKLNKERDEKLIKEFRQRHSEEDLDNLSSACIMALLNNEEFVLVAYRPTHTLYPGSMPKGRVERREGRNIQIRRTPSRQMLEWLHKHGFSNISFDDVVYMKQMWKWNLGVLERKFNKVLDIDVDNDQLLVYNSDTEMEN